MSMGITVINVEMVVMMMMPKARLKFGRDQNCGDDFRIETKFGGHSAHLVDAKHG